MAPVSNEEPTGITVFSGGTAANSLVDVFNTIARERKCHLSYVIPISDNGGSSSELIRFVGGPSVGDIRSRLVRLIPNHDGDEERTALKVLFEYRLSKDPVKARAEWLDMVEARHLLWTFISSQKRELIRAVLNTLNLEIVKRARPTSVFNFAEASLGNLFLTGARIFSGSFESAIYLLRIICSIPDDVSVLPAINSNFTHHISAGLADGTQITGQVAISHPSAPTSIPDYEGATGGGPSSSPPQQDSSAAPSRPGGSHTHDHHDSDGIEDANLPGSLPILRQQHIAFSKDAADDLPARVARVWYINPYGHEIWPLANPAVLAALRASRTVVYSIGSLYTSIVPSLVLRGVGSALAAGGGGDDGGSGGVRHRVLVLNAKIDRETGPRADPMTARDFMAAIARAAAQSAGVGGATELQTVPDAELARYVSHLVYLEGEGAPAVDVPGLTRLGVACVKVQRRRLGGGRGGAMWRYDEELLRKALDGIIDS